ncbi:protein of unknown function [Candidatus Nitrotoga arctica]|uniref:Uncharacterized protein n=1 Tax=Candidatus Nitrotoga arctica TaxID=453162 RepID=A0ABM8YZE1_9PROT|nr:protein of unknown function [Candidatus Nitrotoga arctica]
MVSLDASNQLGLICTLYLSKVSMHLVYVCTTEQIIRQNCNMHISGTVVYGLLLSFFGVAT